jgi:hypothetical protein
MTAKTSSRLASATVALPVRTRETVAGDTPASSATSRIRNLARTCEAITTFGEPKKFVSATHFRHRFQLSGL